LNVNYIIINKKQLLKYIVGKIYKEKQTINSMGKVEEALESWKLNFVYLLNGLSLDQLKTIVREVDGAPSKEIYLYKKLGMEKKFIEIQFEKEIDDLNSLILYGNFEEMLKKGDLQGETEDELGAQLITSILSQNSDNFKEIMVEMAQKEEYSRIKNVLEELAQTEVIERQFLQELNTQIINLSENLGEEQKLTEDEKIFLLDTVQEGVTQNLLGKNDSKILTYVSVNEMIMDKTRKNSVVNESVEAVLRGMITEESNISDNLKFKIKCMLEIELDENLSGSGEEETVKDKPFTFFDSERADGSDEIVKKFLINMKTKKLVYDCLEMRDKKKEVDARFLGELEKIFADLVEEMKILRGIVEGTSAISGILEITKLYSEEGKWTRTLKDKVNKLEKWEEQQTTSFLKNLGYDERFLVFKHIANEVAVEAGNILVGNVDEGKLGKAFVAVEKYDEESKKIARKVLGRLLVTRNIDIDKAGEFLLGLNLKIPFAKSELKRMMIETHKDIGKFFDFVDGFANEEMPFLLYNGVNNQIFSVLEKDAVSVGREIEEGKLKEELEKIRDTGKKIEKKRKRWRRRLIIGAILATGAGAGWGYSRMLRAEMAEKQGEVVVPAIKATPADIYNESMRSLDQEKNVQTRDSITRDTNNVVVEDAESIGQGGEISIGEIEKRNRIKIRKKN